MNFEQPFRMKFKLKRIIRNLAEQEKNSSNSYGHKKNFLPLLSLSSLMKL